VTAALAQAGLCLLAVAAQHLYYRPALRSRLHHLLVVPAVGWAVCARRSLAALDRAAHLRPYQGHHTSRTSS
jgi:hypothetical protein